MQTFSWWNRRSEGGSNEFEQESRGWQYGLDETADNDTSWKEIVVDASGDLNTSHNLKLVSIEGERTYIQVIDTIKSQWQVALHTKRSLEVAIMVLTCSQESWSVASYCTLWKFPPPDDRLEMYSEPKKRPDNTFMPSCQLKNDGFDDEKINLPLLADGSLVYSEED